jgi:hypothetical protein
MHAILQRAAFALLAAVLLAPAAAAQTRAGDQWSSWAGCWRLVTEKGTIVRSADQPTVCVAEAPGGARLTTTIGGKSMLEQTIVADGTSRPVDERDCQGTERHEWSANGLRLYSSAELKCTRDPAPRRVSGYALLVQDGSWLDIQAAELNGRDTLRIRRYERVDRDATRRTLPGQAIGLDDVKEAIGKLAPAAIEAAIVESDSAIPLSSKLLLDLEKARVPGRVIDLLVAVAYPESFVVDRAGRVDRGPIGGWGGMSPWWGPGGLAAGSPFYAYPYYFSPFAYGYDGWYSPYFDGGGVVVVGGVTPNPSQPPPSGAGRVVDGQGYTRVRPRDAETDRGSQRGIATTASSGSSGSPAPAPDTSSSSGSSSGSSASPAGFSSGGGSSDSGRTAVPR